ncbi:MAG: glycerophosphodiester phosphodiesterase [Sporichthyaceae bacterium]
MSTPVPHRRRALILALVLGGALSVLPTQLGHAAARKWEIVAHRGGLVAAPEHTAAAFDHLTERGADSVELDVRFTRDNKAVVFHDERLNRTTDCKGLVSRISLRQLKKCDAGSWFDSEFAGAEVFTLSRALKYLHRRDANLTYYLHVKDSTRFAARTLKRIVKARDVGNQVVPITGLRAGLTQLRAAGFRTLGYVFNRPAEFNTDVEYLIPFNVSINDAVIALARRRGQILLPVENHPHSLRSLDRLDLDGVLANDVDGALLLAGRLDPGDVLPERGFREPESTIEPEGPARTTGPMDF